MEQQNLENPWDGIEPDERIVKRLAGTSDQSLLTRWHEIIEIIREELTYLNHQRQVMQAATDVYNENPTLLAHNGRQFFNYVREWYGGAMALGYRRQTDIDGGSASLRVLLEEMLVRPQAYTIGTLRPFMGVATDETIRSFVMRSVLNQNGELDVEILKKDIHDLKVSGKAVRRFVNKFLAHTDLEFKRNEHSGPTYNEIHAAQAECERIARRWIAALTGAAYTFRVTEQFDWLDIFDLPWRLNRPHDSPHLRRYVVSVERIVGDAEMEEAYGDEDPEARKKNLDREILNLVYKADAVELGDRELSAEFVAPYMVQLERIR